MTYSRTLIWCYVPVIHEGYLRWFAEHPGADIAIVTQSDILDQRYLVKDIRRLHPNKAQAMLARILNVRVMTVGQDEMQHLVRGYSNVVMPDEPIMHELWSTVMTDIPAEFRPVFLRWHRDNILLESQPASTGPVSEAHGAFWVEAQRLARQSPDWWRQIGCCVVRDGEILVGGYNHPLPSTETVLFQGDPRAVFNKGVHLDLSSFVHGEASVISQAARHGIALEGTDMYVTTFPCPPCAKLVAESGISRLFFGSGYSVLDGNEVLAAAGVEVIGLTIE